MTQLILQLKEIVPEYNPSTPALRHALIRKESATRHEKRARALAAAGKHRLSCSIGAAHTLLERSRSNRDPAPLRARRIWRGRNLRHLATPRSEKCDSYCHCTTTLKPLGGDTPPDTLLNKAVDSGYLAVPEALDTYSYSRVNVMKPPNP
jgi:hypothetical protein